MNDDLAAMLVRVGGAIGVSVVAHVLLVGAALALSLSPGWGAVAEPEPIAIEILASTNDARPEERVVTPEPEEDAVPQPVVREEDPLPHRPRHVPTVRETDARTPQDQPPATIEMPSVREEPSPPTETDEQRRARARILAASGRLDPSRIASDWYVPEGPGPTMPGPPAGLGRDRGPTEQEIEASLGSGLRNEAMARRHITRTTPEFQRRADGSMVHSGHRFTAIIDPCGELTFQDRPSVETEGISASGSFDLGDLAMQGSGQDPHAAERNWVGEHTREMREQMEERCRAQEMQQALRTLRVRLERIWATANRTPYERRRRIFGVWDDMDDGEAGREARQIVIRFIRETIPAGSEDAYTEDEVTRFNARRTSREPFAPY